MIPGGVAGGQCDFGASRLRLSAYYPCRIFCPRPALFPAGGQQLGRVVVVNPAEYGVGKIYAAQPQRLRFAVGGRVIGVGDGTRPLPVALPEGALAPVAADVVLAHQEMPRHQVGAEEKALGVAADQAAHRRRVPRRLAHHPLGGAGVEVEVRVLLQERFEVIGVLDVAAHVGADPGHIRELLQHALQADVLVGLGTELARVGVDGAKPASGSETWTMTVRTAAARARRAASTRHGRPRTGRAPGRAALPRT